MHASSVTRLSGRGIRTPCLTRQIWAVTPRDLYRAPIHTRRKLHGSLVPEPDVQQNMVIQSQPSFQNFFSANTSIDRGWLKNGFLAAWQTASRSSYPRVRKHTVTQTQPLGSTEPSTWSASTSGSLTATMEPSVTTQALQSAEPHSDGLLPHRKRRSTVPSTVTTEQQLPLDASSQLVSAASAMPKSASARRRFATYLSLTKPRLSFLIILTTASAYSLYPIPEIISSTTLAIDETSKLSATTLTLAFLGVGTFLCSASANTFNMLFEPKYDAMMTRTRNRPLVRKLISQRAAAIFGVVCGAGGVLLLQVGTNSTVAFLGGLNIFLYAGVYTPMKRLSPVNTWVGAIVGGIPPLMGWAAAAGEAATSEHHSWQDLLLSESSIGGWLLATLLFAWQFPHFNSLSHTIREDYRNAGHKMLAWTNPARNARVALRYSVAMFPLCGSLYWAGVVNSGFLFISTACNTWMLKEAVRFWRQQGAGGSARGLFWASVWQLPLVLVGALVCKTGIWDGLFEKEPVEKYDPVLTSGAAGDQAL